MNNNNTTEAIERIEKVLSHISNVQRNCYKLGMALIKAGEFEMGRNLIANGQIHDNSKFKGIEFEHLWAQSLILSDVVKHHSSTNPHHPEFWGGIHKMPEIYIAEMVCDCYSRSQEMGENIREWFEHKATMKYYFSMNDEIGRSINRFLNMILEQPFKKQ